MLKKKKKLQKKHKVGQEILPTVVTTKICNDFSTVSYYTAHREVVKTLVV